MNMSDDFKSGGERPITEKPEGEPKRLSSVMAVVHTANWLHQADETRRKIAEKTPPAWYVPPAPKNSR